MIGYGATAQVFRARYGGRVVAAKRMPCFGWDGDMMNALASEAHALSQLRHPNVVQYFGLSVHRDHIYIVTEYCAGGTLETLALRAERAARGERAPTLAWTPSYAGLALGIAHGLAYLHTRRFVHRDMKPANVLVDDGAATSAKLCDFGLAKRRAHDAASLTMTTGVGTPVYMAPESILGESAGDGSAVDVYSLSMVLYAMWFGRHPYTADEHSAPFRLMMRIAAGERPALDADGAMPPALRALVVRCWAAEPAARPPIAEVVVALEQMRGELSDGDGAASIPEAETPPLLDCGGAGV